MTRRPGRTKIGGAFSPHLIEMLESPAWRVLSLSARRFLDRLEIELGHHGGDDNGRLPSTYEQLEEYGMDRHSIAPAIREAVALGFVEITEHGRAGNREYRRPTLFRLTYRHTRKANPTDEWRKVETIEQAQAIAKAARGLPRRSLKKISSGGISRISVGVSHTENIIPLVGVSPITGQGGKTPTTSISREGVGAATSLPQAASASALKASEQTSGVLRQ